MLATRSSVRQRNVRLGRDVVPRFPRRAISPSGAGPGQRFTRRGFLAGAGTAAAGAGALFASAAPVAADDDDDHGKGKKGACRPGAPRPIPGEDPLLAGLGLHVFLPTPGQEPSTIFDFKGRVAIVDLIGDGVRSVNGVEEEAAFRADLRLMEGTYIGLDGERHENAFGFI